MNEAGSGVPAPWIDDANAALLTDLYELTMLRAYWQEGMDGEAVFSLFVRRLPAARNYLLACGLDDALRYLETLRFPPAGLDFLRRALATLEAQTVSPREAVETIVPQSGDVPAEVMCELMSRYPWARVLPVPEELDYYQAKMAAVRQVARRTICRTGQTACCGLIDEPTTSPSSGVKMKWFSWLKRVRCQPRGSRFARWRAA